VSLICTDPSAKDAHKGQDSREHDKLSRERYLVLLILVVAFFGFSGFTLKLINAANVKDGNTAFKVKWPLVGIGILGGQIVVYLILRNLFG
jgi:hypothetical protein